MRHGSARTSHAPRHPHRRHRGPAVRDARDRRL